MIQGDLDMRKGGDISINLEALRLPWFIIAHIANFRNTQTRTSEIILSTSYSCIPWILKYVNVALRHFREKFSLILSVNSCKKSRGTSRRV